MNEWNLKNKDDEEDYLEEFVITLETFKSSKTILFSNFQTWRVNVFWEIGSKGDDKIRYFKWCKNKWASVEMWKTHFLPATSIVTL